MMCRSSMKHAKKIHPLFKQYLKPRKEEIKEHALLKAFQFGVADKSHYDELIRMVNTVMMIGMMQDDKDVIKQGEILKDFVTQIYNRYQAKNSFVLNAELLDTLTGLVTQYDDFILSQHPNVLNRAKIELALFENEKRVNEQS